MPFHSRPGLRRGFWGMFSLIKIYNLFNRFRDFRPAGEGFVHGGCAAVNRDAGQHRD